MKKFTAILIILALSLALAGCGTPPEIYAEAVENYRAAAGITCNYNMSITLTGDGETDSASMAGKFLINNGESRKASLTGSSTLMSASGDGLSVKIAAYYDGAKYYGSLSGTGVCYAADWSEVLAQIGQYGFAENLTETDFEGILSEEIEGGEVITYVVPGRNAVDWTGIPDLWERITEGGSASITAVQGTLTLDEDRKPIKQEIEISGSVVNGQRTISVSQKITTEIVLSEEAVAVAAPVTTDYKEITK